MSFDFEFLYFRYPEIRLGVSIEAGSINVPATALLDTGSELSLFEMGIALDIGLDLSDAPSIRISGLGGNIRDAKLAFVQLQLLEQPELSASLEVAFAPGIEILSGNILGLDVLSLFDVALSHSKRLGYLGRTDS